MDCETNLFLFISFLWFQNAQSFCSCNQAKAAKDNVEGRNY